MFPVITSHNQPYMSKRNNIAVFFFFVSLFLSSCKPILQVYFGMRKPKPVGDETIVHYYHKKGLATNNIFRPVDDSAWVKIIKLFPEAPEVYIYDEQGREREPHDTTVCNAHSFNVTDHICDTIQKLKIIQAHPFDAYAHLLRWVPCKGAKEQKITPPCVIITAARFDGRLNKDHVKVYEDSVLISNCGVHVYKIDLDILKH